MVVFTSGIIDIPHPHPGSSRPHRGRTATRDQVTGPGSGFLRKEVIQPHLPVRLPCYDFTPIANPTFGSSFPKGLGH